MSDEPTNKREYPPDYFADEVLLSEAELIEDLTWGHAINKILHQTATAATFRNVVRLLRIPDRLSPIVGVPVIPALMKSLRRYCQHSRPYDSTYGFYCVEIIVFMLGAGIMMEPVILKWCIDQLEKLPDLDNIFEDHVRLGDFVAHWFPEDERLSREIWKAHTSTGVLAPSLGGFTTEDLHYLVDTLFQDRKQMLRMHSIAGTSPVWWYGIYILAMFNEYTLRDRTLTHMIYAIALRIELNSAGDKHDLLDRVIATIGMRRHESRSARVLAKVTDLEDAKLVLSRYYEYIPTCGKRGGPFVIGMISTWAGKTAYQLGNFELHLEYLKRHVDALWEVILREDNVQDNTLEHLAESTSSQIYLIFLAEHLLRTAEAMIAKASPEEQYIYVKTLIEEGDFLNLMGRILLWFVRFDCPEMLLEPAAEQTLKFGAVITHFTMSIQSVHKRVDDRIPYIIGSIMDGMKVARFLGEAIITCPLDNRELYNYLATVAVIWDRIRGLIPNMSSLCCVNPVCGKANAQWICTGCRNAFYCGRRCQKRHWRYRGVGHPHWLECETQSMQGIEPLLEYGKVLGLPHE